MKTGRSDTREMMRRMFAGGFLQIQEVATVSQRLNEQKDRVQQQRHRREKDSLFRGKRWAARRSSKIWQHQTEYSQGHDHVEVSVDTLDVVMLFAISQPAKHERQTYKAIEGDHD